MYTIRTLTTVSELYALADVFARAFESAYPLTDTYATQVVSDKRQCILGAWLDTTLVGGLVAYEMQPLHGTKEFYIYDIAVDPAHQKRGIGTMLLTQLESEARARGIGTICVEAEADDDGAVAFYRSLQGEEIAVRHFNFKVLDEH